MTPTPSEHGFGVACDAFMDGDRLPRLSSQIARFIQRPFCNDLGLNCWCLVQAARDQLGRHQACGKTPEDAQITTKCVIVDPSKAVKLRIGSLARYHPLNGMGRELWLCRCSVPSGDPSS